jgi:hypothetical protein
MTSRHPKRGFVTRPTDPDAWIRAPEPQPEHKADLGFTARLTIDVTPAQRGRIKIIAFQRGITVADMLRDLLAREFPEDGRSAP